MHCILDTFCASSTRLRWNNQKNVKCVNQSDSLPRTVGRHIMPPREPIRYSSKLVFAAEDQVLERLANRKRIGPLSVSIFLSSISTTSPFCVISMAPSRTISEATSRTVVINSRHLDPKVRPISDGQMLSPGFIMSRNLRISSRISLLLGSSCSFQRVFILNHSINFRYLLFCVQCIAESATGQKRNRRADNGRIAHQKGMDNGHGYDLSHAL